MEPTGGNQRLTDSRLYTFIDRAREFAIYFLEGQRLIHDLALIHPVRERGFAYFRDVVLSVQPMIAFLKHGEQFGLYIDSEQPYFRFKLETGHAGTTRSTLMPEEFEEFPERLDGIVRLHKLSPSKAAYESILQIESLPLRDIVNRVLRDSYQTNSAVLVSGSSDQSVLLHQLPPLRGKDEYDYSIEALRQRREEIRQSVERIFALFLDRPAEIEAAFAELDFRLLASRPVRFGCTCSREGVVRSLTSIHLRDRSSLFDPGQTSLSVKCEYCKTSYEIRRQELEGSGEPLH